MIKWDDAYAIGDPSIDNQHKMLFQYVNDLETAVKDKGVNHSLILRVLEFFEDYAKMHFGMEETCMYRYKCPIANTNKLAHQHFIDAYENYRILLNKEGASIELFDTMLTWTQQWLLNHICKIDAQLRPHLTSPPQEKESAP